jgi:hypothetical protein
MRLGWIYGGCLNRLRLWMSEVGCASLRGGGTTTKQSHIIVIDVVKMRM